MAGFGMAIAGALEGVGQGMVASARAKREEALKTLEIQRQDARDQRDMEFRSTEAEKARQFQSAEGEKDRKFQMENRQGDVMTLEDGTAAYRQGSVIKPITDATGKPVKTMRTPKDAPADVQTAEWLVKNGVADNLTEAWGLVRQARVDPEKSRAAIYTKWVDALTKGAIGNVDGVKVQQDAQKLTEDTLSYLNSKDDKGAAPASSGSEPRATAPKSTGTEKAGRYPPAPRDPAERKVGTVYAAPDGRAVRWRGQGWELVK